MTLKTRRNILLILSACLMLTAISSIIVHNIDGNYTSSACEYIGLFLSILLIFFLTYNIDFIICLRSNAKSDKKECPFLSKEDCPYFDKLQCPYDTSHCRAHNKKGKRLKRTLAFGICLVFCFLLYLASVVFIEDESISKIIEPICLSVISAFAVAIFIDVPGRLKEHQEHFVELLSSNEYLKYLNDGELTKLRKQITWVQHAKDYPNMPRELIELDEKLCNMLKEPYFEEFTQIVDLTKEEDKITKHCSVEYTIQNPSKDKKAASVDVGLSISVMLPPECIDNEDKLSEEARKVLHISKFVAYDDKNNTYNLMPYIRALIYTGVTDNTEYNAEIHLAPLHEYSNKSNPLSIKNLTQLDDTTNVKPTFEKSTIDQIDFCVEFEESMVIKFEYDVVVPEKDKCFSKRLRYPVKYFKLDYTLGQGFEDTKLSGQLIGTLIDQKNISFYQSADKKHLSFWTHSWLLPKNGVFVVHSN